jgi:hypothetical protein
MPFSRARLPCLGALNDLDLTRETVETILQLTFSTGERLIPLENLRVRNKPREEPR